MASTLNQHSSLFGASKVRKQYKQQKLSRDQCRNNGCLVLHHGVCDGVSKAGCLLFLALEACMGFFYPLTLLRRNILEVH